MSLTAKGVQIDPNIDSIYVNAVIGIGSILV